MIWERVVGIDSPDSTEVWRTPVYGPATEVQTGAHPDEKEMVRPLKGYLVKIVEPETRTHYAKTVGITFVPGTWVP